MTRQKTGLLRKALLFIWILVLSVGPAIMTRAASLPVQEAVSLKKAKKKKLNGVVKIKKTYYYMKNGEPMTSKAGRVVTVKVEKKSKSASGGGSTTPTQPTSTQTQPEAGQAQAASSAQGTEGGQTAADTQTGTSTQSATETDPAKPEFEKIQLFVDSDGTLRKGWHLKNEQLYHTEKKGIIQAGKKVDGVRINKKGWAKANAKNLKKVSKYSLELMAASVAASVAGSAGSRSDKLRRIWNFMSSGGNFYYIRVGEDFDPSSARSRAMNMLKNRGGNCFDFACAFAALCEAVGYDAYVVYGIVASASGGTTTHGWVYLSGVGYFDVEGEFAGWGRGVYGYGNNPYRETGRVHI